MSRTQEEIREQRRGLKAEYGELFESTSAILFRHDPAHINFDVNKDEYEPEAGTILPRLRNCQSMDEVLRVVHEEFVRWFGLGTAGPSESYKEIASEIWRLWQRHQETVKVTRAF